MGIKSYEHFHKLTDAQQSLVHQYCCYAWNMLDNVDMYKHAQFHLDIPFGLRVISVFANC